MVEQPWVWFGQGCIGNSHIRQDSSVQIKTPFAAHLSVRELFHRSHELSFFLIIWFGLSAPLIWGLIHDQKPQTHLWEFLSPEFQRTPRVGSGLSALPFVVGKRARKTWGGMLGREQERSELNSVKRLYFSLSTFSGYGKLCNIFYTHVSFSKYWYLYRKLHFFSWTSH